MFANAQASTFRFGMVTSWPTSLDTIFGGALNTAKFLNEITQGDVEVEVYPAGAQVGGLEVYDAVSSGAFEMGHTASYYYVGKDPAHAYFTSLPFGMNAQQHNAWMLSRRRARICGTSSTRPTTSSLSPLAHRYADGRLV